MDIITTAYIINSIYLMSIYIQTYIKYFLTIINN